MIRRRLPEGYDIEVGADAFKGAYVLTRDGQYVTHEYHMDVKRSMVRALNHLRYVARLQHRRRVRT